MTDGAAADSTDRLSNHVSDSETEDDSHDMLDRGSDEDYKERLMYLADRLDNDIPDAEKRVVGWVRVIKIKRRVISSTCVDCACHFMTTTSFNLHFISNRFNSTVFFLFA